MEEFGRRHVSAPTIAAAHCLRLVSAEKGQREQVVKLMQLPQPSKASSDVNREEIIEKLHEALYGATLACFVQGMNVRSSSFRQIGH